LLAIQKNLLAFAYALTTNRDDAYDLVQNTSLQVLTSEDKYTENVNFKGWVFTIMRNIFINNYRRVVRQATVIDRTEDLFHLNISQDSGVDTPEGTMAAEEISKAINSFSDEYRIPFAMHAAGYKYSEIAEKMNLPVGTIKSRIFFARQRLQQMLADYRRS
jgi:RNA polymerase sigma-70 factor (ECF subfamily)